MKRSVTGIKMMKQIAALRRHMTAAAQRTRQHRARSSPALSQGKATDRLETEEERVPKQAGLSGEEELRCQAPEAIQASAGHVNGLPGQLS